MAYSFSTNNTPTTSAQAAWLLVSTMIAAGWSKLMDSDGTTYSSGGTQVTGGGTGAHGLGNNNAWVRLRSPDGSREFTIQNGYATAVGYWRVKYSPSAHFTGGSPGASQTPSATDECIALGSGTDGSPVFTPWFYGGEGAYRFSCGANDAAPYDVWSFGFLIGGSVSGGCHAFIFDQMVATTYPSNDADPFAVYCDGTSVAATHSELNSSNNWSGQWQGTSYSNTDGLYVVDYGVSAPQGGTPQDPVTLKDQLMACQLIFLDGTIGGTKGNLSHHYWEITGTTSSPRNTPSAIDVVTSRDTIVVGCCTFTWDGSNPTI